MLFSNRFWLIVTVVILYTSEDYLASRDVAVEELRAAVVGPAIPQKVVVDPDVSVASLLQPSLALTVAVGDGAGLDAPEVTVDPAPEVVDVVVLNIDHPVPVALN